ncbi:hypothetical protein CTheo_6911 [Ceratobasidium theobromae]|uniref:Uncharacterized protein n=1 Tax=Ceratobasidium theobromae TaxID=1582974 RepID=A0A5N5QDW6_9AGAM|nr:hypothetical protein CTheo_6911 [Ceratobasidium theobromae]
MSSKVEDSLSARALCVVGEVSPQDLELVNSATFEKECKDLARQLNHSSDESSGNEGDLWSDSEQTVSCATTVDSDPNEPSKMEQYMYYAGIRGAKGRGGPKLIWRDSTDVFVEPTGPEEYKRTMRVIPVQGDHGLATKVSEGVIRWDECREHIVGLLKQGNISISSVDFVRFTWVNKSPATEGDSDEEEETQQEDDEVYDIADYAKIARIAPVEEGTRVTSEPTVWIGVTSESLTATAASEVAKGIREYLDGLDVGRIDIAFRESKFKFLSGPALFSPVDDGDALKPVIDNVSVTLSLSIQGLKTAMQGTLGPYFHANGNLYAITVRHNLFPLDDNNEEFRYNSSMKKREVMVMGDHAFTNYKSSIQAYIGTLLDATVSLEKRVESYKRKVEEKIDLENSQALLLENEVELSKTRRHIEELKMHFLVIHKKWSHRKNRVIGHVVWAPPISTGQQPHGFTVDLCVIQLNKDKFRNLLGNVLSFGPKHDKSKILSLIYGPDDVPSEFKFPPHGRLKLRDMLTADQVKAPNSKDLSGDPVRRVMKYGFTTEFTIGSLGKFMSFVRKYFPTGHQESIELPIFNHESEPGTFSKGGDSGSLIVDIMGRFVSLLTGGSNTGTDGSDITYSTLFKYVWELVCVEFPGADLYFDDLSAVFPNLV